MTLTNGQVAVLSNGYPFNAVYATPKNYNPAIPLPLVLEFSGTGQQGYNVNDMYSDGLPQVLASGYQPPFDFIMCAPQAQSYGINPDYIQYILQDVESHYNIDTTRIYIVAFSAGGWGCLGSQMNEPTSLGSKFAALAPLSAATQDLIMSGVSNFAINKTPVWELVGANDVSYVDDNEALVTSINNIVPNLAVIYLQANQGHGGWNNAFNGTYVDATGQTMWQFLYSHKLGVAQQPLQPPTVFAGNDTAFTQGGTLQLHATANQPCSFYWVGICDAANCEVSGLQVGKYSYLVEAIDSMNLTGSDTISVTVTAPLPPPVSVSLSGRTLHINSTIKGTYTVFNESTPLTLLRKPTTLNIGTTQTVNLGNRFLTGTYIFNVTANNIVYPVPFYVP